MKSVYILAVLFLAITLSNAEDIDCDTYCSISSCAGLNKDVCGGTIVKHGGVCGCCDLCRITVSRGQACDSTTSYIPPSLVCESGTSCIDGICQ